MNLNRLLQALDRGMIYAIRGTVYDSDVKYLCSTSELYYLIKQADKLGIRIRRIDAGGSPTWRREP